MGLAIAKGIVEAHRGRIWIEDGPAGRGARIAFTVPVGDEESAQGDNLDSQSVVTPESEQKT